MIDSTEIIHSWAGSGLLGHGVLGLIFVLSGLIWIPRQPLCMVGGLVFGLWVFPVAIIGSTVGAILALLISRVLFRTTMLRMVQRRRMVAAVIDAVTDRGWRIVFLLRLASPVPGIVTNYACGLTNIGLLPYTAATALGLLPQTFLFLYIGATGKVLFSSSSSLLQLLFLLIGVIVMVVICLMIRKSAKESLASMGDFTEQGENPAISKRSRACP